MQNGDLQNDLIAMIQMALIPFRWIYSLGIF